MLALLIPGLSMGGGAPPAPPGVNFPVSLDSFPSAATLAGEYLGTDPHSTLHGNLGLAVSALEVKVGVNSSADTSSLDYLVARITEGRLYLSDVTTADANAVRHGLLPKLSASASQYLDGTGAWSVPVGLVSSFNSRVGAVTPQSGDYSIGQVSGAGALASLNSVTESTISLSDITTDNASASKHGFAPKLSGSASQYLDGTGAWSVPTGGVSSWNSRTGAVTPQSGDYSFSLISGTLGVSQGGTGATSLTAHGVLLGEGTGAITPTAVGATNTVLHGNTGADPSFSAVVEGDLSLSDITTNNVSTSKHGFAPKAPNDATKYLDGTGAYSVPSGGGGSPGGSNKYIQYDNSGSFGGAQYYQIDSGFLNLLPQTAPGGNPSSGFYLYVDSGDSNKLKAKSASGNITVIAYQ